MSDLSAAAACTATAAFVHQRAAGYRIPTLAQRRADLLRLERLLLEQRHRLAAAIDADFGGRAVVETLLMELFGVIDEIRHTRSRLRRWMRPRRVFANWQMQPASAWLRHQPLGIVGVIGAYNYPAYLCLSPLVGALAAGNRVLIKPSEQTPRTAELLRELLASLFPPEQVAVVTGDAAVSRAFAALPFDHLLFTGSARVGRMVLRQASEQLVPVTLELGGKSPAILGEHYPLAPAVRSILHARLINAGQTCVAPDYVLLPESQLLPFVLEARAAVQEMYPALVANPQYTRMISSAAWDRLNGWLQEARRHGAQVETINPAGESCNRDNRVLAPTLVWNCPADAALLREEIFGPVLPLLTYRNLDEALQHINAGSRPLALYLFEHDRRRVEQVLDGTVSGGVTLNGCIYHVAQHELPLGGIGMSGMGQYHGRHGFETFSAKRAVFRPGRLLPLHWLRPPFGKRMAWLLGLLLQRWPRPERGP
ncbi:MAG TPA: aldehyde dehydrogenase family protein [Solimonas sp.]|nr:aldehyde dehydrogenase family protein [Solimonas sp.]